VAYLHYTPEEQINLISSKAKGGMNLNASALINYQLTKETSHNRTPDPHDKASNGKYYISPNVPETDVRLEVKKLESSRFARTTSRSERQAVAVEGSKTKEQLCRERDNARINTLHALQSKDNVIKGLMNQLAKKNK